MWFDEGDVLVPAHRSFVGGLVGCDSEIYLYRGHPSREDQSLYGRFGKFLEKDRTRFRVHVTPENFLELLPLWNARGWSRGSIAFLCDPHKIQYTELFADCFGPTVFGNPGAANSPAALRLCREKSATGLACGLLSASNGFDWAEFFLPPSLIDRGFKAAEKVARESPLHA